jgi:hypothetical protein
MKPSWAIAALGLTLAACGGAAEPDRFSLTTPGAHTGEGNAPAPLPAEVKPVTRAERLVIKGWSDSLRQGRVSAAARYFSVPAKVSNDSANWLPLTTAAEVKAFNQALPCGAKLMDVRRGPDSFVVGTFRLTERKGAGAGCGGGVGGTAAVAFLIRNEHIEQWVRNDDAASDPAATATPTPEPTPPTTG